MSKHKKGHKKSKKNDNLLKIVILLTAIVHLIDGLINLIKKLI